MELPISQQSYQPTPDALMRAVRRAGSILARTMADEAPLDTATAFTNPARPTVHGANYATDVRLPQDLDAHTALGLILDHYDMQNTPCHALESADTVWPDTLSEAIEARGYRPVTQHVYLLHRHTPRATAAHPTMKIIPARAAYGQVHSFYQAMARDEYRIEGQPADDLADSMADHLDESRLELFLCWLDGQPVGSAGVITLGQIGVIQPAYTDAQHRGRGIAGALMSHTLDHCARSLMQQVILERTEGCPSIGFYESIGFRLVGSYVRYAKP